MAENFSQGLTTHCCYWSSFTILIKAILLGRGTSLYFPRLLSWQFWKIVLKDSFPDCCSVHGAWPLKAALGHLNCVLVLWWPEIRTGAWLFPEFGSPTFTEVHKTSCNHPTALSGLGKSAAKSAASVWLWRKLLQNCQDISTKTFATQSYELYFLFLFLIWDKHLYELVDMLCQIYWSQVRWLAPNVLSLHVNFRSWEHFANICRGEYELK